MKKLAYKFFRSLAILLLAATAVQADSIITGSKPYTFTPGTVISSSQVNADFDYIINQVNTNAAKNGVNSSITALLGLTTPIDPNVGGSPIWNATTIGGTANAITVTATRPAISSFSYTVGNIITIVPSATNTAATTINVNSLGVKNILKPSAGGIIALAGGELVIGVPSALYYDGTQFVVLNLNPLFGTRTDIASAGTTDLGTVGSHFVRVTGTTTITSFGSSANTNYPVYFVKFNDVLTITYDGTNIFTPGNASIVTAANDYAWLEYLGGGSWRIAEYVHAVNPPQLETVNNLLIVNNSGTPTTQIDVDADNSILCNTSGYCIKTGAVNLTINAATTGANALDTGALGNNTWYYIYIISDGTTTAGLISTSATAPTMPAGYVYKYRVGTQRTGGAATFLRIQQAGKRAQYVVVTGSTTPNLPIMISGNSGNATTPTWTAVSVSNFLPPVARVIHGSMYTITSGGANEVMVAPNNNYGAIASTTNPPPVKQDNGSNGDYSTYTFSFVLESTNIYYATNGWGAGNAGILAQGWDDAVNAN